MNVKYWPFVGFRQVPYFALACEWSFLEVELLVSNHCWMMEESKNATSEAGFEAKASDESRTGLGRGRPDIFTGGGRVGSGCTGNRCITYARLCTEPSDHAR
jgi:hypothetical protein